jgi:O-antigen ligase
MAATVLPRGRGACLGAGIFGVLLAAAGGLLSLFRYDVTFFVPCQGACNGLGFTGVLPNENLLAIVLTASIPFAYLGFRGRARFWLSVYLLGMAIATGSRTAIAGSTIVFVALLLVRPRLDRVHASLAQSAAAWLVFAGSVVSSVYVVRHHWPASALTTRPALWGVAWRYIHRSPWFGYGPSRWGALYQSSEIPVAAQRTTHNQWTDVLFVGGGVGAGVFVAMVLAAILSSGRARSGVLLVLAAIFLIGTTEGAWAVGSVDLMSFSLVALILTGAVAPEGRTAQIARDDRRQGFAPLQLLRERVL